MHGAEGDSGELLDGADESSHGPVAGVLDDEEEAGAHEPDREHDESALVLELGGGVVDASLGEGLEALEAGEEAFGIVRGTARVSRFVLGAGLGGDVGEGAGGLFQPEGGADALGGSKWESSSRHRSAARWAMVTTVSACSSSTDLTRPTIS